MDKKQQGTPQKSFKARMADLVLHSNRTVSDLAKELGVSVAMVELALPRFGGQRWGDA